MKVLTPRRALLVVGGAALFCLATLILAPLVGYLPAPDGLHLGWLDLSRALAAGPGSGDPIAEIFFVSRLPRTLAGAVCGAGLATAGVTYQALLRNPLAEPYTLGVSSAASLGAVLAIRFGVADLLGSSGIAVCAFAGAALAVFLVWRLARVGGSLPPATLLLAGVTLAFGCSAASMLVSYTASFTETFRITRWLMGGLEVIAVADLVRSALLCGGAIFVLLFYARDFNALAAGTDAASSVGVHADRVTLTAYAAASLSVGAVVALAGPIGFVGLIVPHALRNLVGPDHRALLPASLFAGAGFVVLCDAVARIAWDPHQLPVGVLTALLGAPFFLSILVREKGRSRLWGGGP